MATSTNGDFWRGQFDKLILFATLIMLAGCLIYFLHANNADGQAWAQRAYDNIQGALLMLLTGRMIQRSGDTSQLPNHDGGPNAAPTTTEVPATVAAPTEGIK